MVRIYSIIIFGSFRYDFWFATKLHVIWCCRYDWNSNMIYPFIMGLIVRGEKSELKVPQKKITLMCKNAVCTFAWKLGQTLFAYHSAIGNMPRHLMKHVILFLFLRIVMPMIRWCNVANSTILSLAFNVLSASSSKVVVLLVAHFLGEYIENVLLSK